MKARLAAVLQEVAADLAQAGFDDQFLNRSVARMKALSVETEDERREYLAGYVRFVEYLVAQAPAEVVEILKEQERIVKAHFDRMYGRPATPYLESNRIVATLLEALKTGSGAEEAVVQALSEVESLPFGSSPEDAVIKMGALLRIRALERTRNWFAQETHEGPVEETLVALVKHIEAAAGEGTLDTALILKFAGTIKEPTGMSLEAREIIASMLMLVFGLGLMFRADTAPGLEPLRDRIIELLSPAPAPPPETTCLLYTSPSPRD